ncbi:hypothetical protein NFC73_17625 [Pseudarthrobacter sp. RMG13]|uniref:Uncharacterized protein n=1 Tax=Pseudarthrobacter humi TaxID=2952523 RepID=A0ABT1LST9_9MICC|nr:hypothetical protein [Pseudarthrobacter humi]MCP9001532.1 hypothetical protein [Pseudarthrobacter humi]
MNPSPAQAQRAPAGQTRRIGEGLAVQGEGVQDAGPDIKSWLQRTGLLKS